MPIPQTTAQNADKKSGLLLGSGQLKIIEAGASHAKAIVRGSSGSIYELNGHRNEDNDTFGCTCPAQTECYHIVALKKIWRSRKDG